MSDKATTQPKGAIHLSDEDFQKALDTAGMPVLVDFYAEWCGPCKLAAPIIEKLADEYRGKVLMAKLDVDENSATAQKYGVMSIPTVIIFKKDGDQVKEVDRKIGFPGEAGYRQMIDKVAPQTAVA